MSQQWVRQRLRDLFDVFTTTNNSATSRQTMQRCRGSVAKLIMLGLLCAVATMPQAEPTDTPAQPQGRIQLGEQQASDAAITARINTILREIPAFRNVNVSVQSGVVRLTGKSSDFMAAQRAEDLISRIDGVVTIENSIERNVSLNSQLTPALDGAKTILNDTIALLPLLTLALLLFIAIFWMGSFLAGRVNFWKHITPNTFIAELASTTVRIVFFILALVLMLNLLGSTALLSAVLGSAGVIGLAVGFAVRDTIENYIASIMLSLRQPFRPNDHVVINKNEGRIIRLTSRATVLMTVDGNHLRIPNAEVFKSTILNYTSNPERRFDFELGVDANDDPLAAIQTGIQAMRALNFVLQEPPPLGLIKQVGDSNIVIFYAAWINQRDADFGKSRSVALASVKNALEAAGFGLPEPIYRLRLDPSAAGLLNMQQQPMPEHELTPSAVQKTPAQDEALDIAPDNHLVEKVEEERRVSAENDLLNAAAPAE